MKSFSNSDIEICRETFVRAGYPKRELKLEGHEFDYFILPERLFQMDGVPIPNGLFRMTGRKKDGCVIGVSTEVPAAVRPYFAFSEFNEFMVHGLENPNRTLLSEQDMLRILNESPFLRSLYVNSKLSLYNHLIRESEGQLSKWRFTRADYNGFEAARDFLKSK